MSKLINPPRDSDPVNEEVIHRCLVTGATGFIGSQLCGFLKKQGFFVRAGVRSLTHALQHSIVCDEALEVDLKHLTSKQDLMHSMDTVFHLAGLAHASSSLRLSKETYYRINVAATEQLMLLAHQAGVKRFIYFSSVKAQTTDEMDYYGQSKKDAEMAVLTLGKKFNLQVSILRPALVYGPKVKGNLAMMIQGIRQGWFPRLPEVKNKRSLVSIEDLMCAALAVAKNKIANGQIYTITDGQSYSSKQLYDAIRQALGKPPCRWTLPAFIFKCAAFCGDLGQKWFKCSLPFNSEVFQKLLGSEEYSNTAILNDLGWLPKTNFFQSVSRMI